MFALRLNPRRACRCLAALALIVSLLAPGAAMAGAAAMGETAGGEGATMACCRKGAKSHNCCPRKAKSSTSGGGASLQSASQCGKTCCPAQLPSPASAVLAAPRTAVAYNPVWVALLVSGTGSVRPIALPDPLSQRPPPALLLSL